MKTRIPALRPAAAIAALTFGAALPLAAQLSSPLLFVTQVAPARPHHTVTSIDGSLLATTAAAPRGGDLMIVYPDRTVKNLTRAAGYGIPSQIQAGYDAIAVRDPHVHWSGTKALFSMVQGAPENAADQRAFHWQIYEVTGLGKDETPVIAKIANQHPDFNNVQPAYLSDGRIVYGTDCSIKEQRHLYPALDEKGMGPAGTGLWTLNPAAEDRTPAMLTHAPSGAFEPFVDSFGRIMFTRWDLLQRDELAAVPAHFVYDYTSESADAAYSPWAEMFPEPLPTSGQAFGLSFDLFLPWTINQDGHELNTLNHLGRHELTPDFPRSGPQNGLIDFATLVADLPPGGALPALTRATAFLQLSEHPASPGQYIGIDVLATGVSAGRAVSVLAPPSRNPDDITVRLISQLGLVRDPSWLSNGRLAGSWVPGPQLQHSHYGDAENAPIPPDFLPQECFTIRVANGPVRLETGVSPVPPAQITTTQFVDGAEVTRTAYLWQLQPVEVRSRTVPPPLTVPLENPEASVFIRSGVSPSGFKSWLQEENMAVIVCRDVTTRDKADRQQPFSIEVPDGASGAVNGVTITPVTRMQFFQGDYLRAYATAAATAPEPGRRITARKMHDESFSANPPSNTPPGSVPLGSDGSMAAIVPAQRAVSWQLEDGTQDKAVVRERYWLSFQSGEVRMCTSCHGVNRTDQKGRGPATNSPEALRTLLDHWKSGHSSDPAASTPYRVWSEIRLSDPSSDTMSQNPDHDALTNLEEFLYGSDPRTAARPDDLVRALSLTAASGEGASLEFTRSEDAASLEVVAESSSGLDSWSEAARLAESGATAAEGCTIQEITTPAHREARLTAWRLNVSASESSQRRFFRLRFPVP